MKLLLIIFILMCVACSPSMQNKHDDDYVLVEFASKLEEDYHRIQKIPYEPEYHHESTPEESDDGQLPDHHHP